MALGAAPRDIAVLVGSQAGLWTAAGIALGLAGSAVLSRLARGVLFQVSPYDPAALIAAVAALALAATVAAWRPAWRASRVDPAVSLRAE